MKSTSQDNRDMTGSSQGNRAISGCSEKAPVMIAIQPQSIIVYNPDVCNGCKNLTEPLCVKACRNDMLIPSPEKGTPPLVAFSDECCECGCCVHACPHALAGAITMNWSVAKLVRWKRKDSGRHFRLGMPDPPRPNERPPVSGYYPKSNSN